MLVWYLLSHLFDQMKRCSPEASEHKDLRSISVSTLLVH